VTATVELEGVAESAGAAAAASAVGATGSGSFFKLIFAPVLGGKTAAGLTLTVALAAGGGATGTVCPPSAVGDGAATVLPLPAAGRIFKPVVAVEGTLGGAGVAVDGAAGAGVAAGLAAVGGNGAPSGFLSESFIVEVGTTSTDGFAEEGTFKLAVSVDKPAAAVADAATAGAAGAVGAAGATGAAGAGSGPAAALSVGTGF